MSEGPVPSNSVFDQIQWLNVPELAAFRSGRLANQIQHQTTVLWLLGYEREADPSLGLPAYRSSLIPWRDLKIAGRHAIADQRQRMTFEQQVDLAEDAWKKQFQRIWHFQLIEDQNEQIEVDRQRSIPEEDGPRLREIIASRCRLVLGSVDEIIHSLRDTLLTASDAELLGMFRLGQHVDRLVHPVPAFAELLTSDSDAFPRTAASTAPDQPATWEEFLHAAEESRLSCEGDDMGIKRQIWNSRLRSAPRRLPRNPLPSSLPSEEWWMELASLAVASGFSSSFLQQVQCERNDEVNSSQSAVQRIVDRIEAVVTQAPTGAAGSEDKSRGSNLTAQSKSSTDGCDQIPKDLVSEDPEERLEWTRFTSVGIEIQRELLQVRQPGSNRGETVPTRLSFNVLVYIAQKGGGYRSRAELESEWESLGGSSGGETSIDSCLVTVRKVLKKLGLKLDNKTNVGWRIEAATDA